MKKPAVRIIFFLLLIYTSFQSAGQLNWVNVDSLYQPLPSSVHVFKSNEPLDGKSNIAFYLIADLKDKKIFFDTDTTMNRRLTPSQFYQKNDNPLLIVNSTFFSFQTNRSLNVVIKNGKLLSINPEFVIGRRGTDTAARLVPFRSAIGITRHRVADVAWIKTDSAKNGYSAHQLPGKPRYRNQDWFEKSDFINYDSIKIYLGKGDDPFRGKKVIRWKMQTAVGGGPVILQKGKVFITNEEEMMFSGKAIDDKHPRTAMGYTRDNKLIILAIQGRFPGIAEGATLGQEAKILQDLGCWEAINLDGGGSSCMLINGIETIKPSDKEGQRAVPAVFIIKERVKK